VGNDAKKQIYEYEKKKGRERGISSIQGKKLVEYIDLSP